LVEDEPLEVRTSSGVWRPTDYDGAVRGLVTVRHALEQSLNIPFARMGLVVGAGRIVSVAQRLGIRSKLDPVPSLALGSSEVTLLELARAYGVFATQGNLAETRWILNWRDARDTIREGPRPYITEVADPATTFLVTSALQGAVKRGTGRGLGAGRFKGDVAGKTGTSNNWRDAWFVAYSPEMVVGVWVGYDDGRSVRMSGGAAAVPIVSEFLKGARSFGRTSFRVPGGIERNYVSSVDWWPCGDLEFFLRGTAPPTYETVVQLFALRPDSVATSDSLTQPGVCPAIRTPW
jgi:membrane peptidoglycan carboxypeptidase